MTVWRHAFEKKEEKLGNQWNSEIGSLNVTDVVQLVTQWSVKSK